MSEALWPLTDVQLWEASCLTRWQIEHWTDDDLKKHTEGVRHTLKFLMQILDEASPKTAPAVTSESK